jgi:hypothetical protein
MTQMTAMESHSFDKNSMESFYINYKPFVYRIMLTLALKIDENLETFESTYTPE